MNRTTTVKQGTQKVKRFFTNGDYHTLTAVILVHIFLGMVHLFIYNAWHPLLGYIKSAPLVFQIISVCCYGTLLYMVAGYILTIAFREKKEFLLGIDFSLTTFSIIMIIIFMTAFVYHLSVPYSSVWYIYSLFNPIIGTFMISVVHSGAIMFFWILGAIIPSLGLLLGMFIRFKQKGVVS